jgi:hypothetical protein
MRHTISTLEQALGRMIAILIGAAPLSPQPAYARVRLRSVGAHPCRR